MQNFRIGLIGAGKMGSAMLLGALRSKAVLAENCWVYSRRSESVQALQQHFAVNHATQLAELLQQVDAVVLATKPKDLPALLGQLAQIDPVKKPLYISLAAGVSITQIRTLLAGSQVVRVMPNTPLLVGEGMSVYAVEGELAPQHQAIVQSLFQASGRLQQLSEEYMNAATGLSGAGPAFCFSVLEGLYSGGVAMGLPAAQAVELAAQTMLGAAKMVLESGLHPAQLRDQVCSPAGATIEGVLKLEQHAVRAALHEAVVAAARRSAELALPACSPR